MDNRSIFIANLGHEFKTPLNAVLGFSQLGISAESIEICFDYFSKINIAAKSMVDMINAMMDYAQVSDPNYQLDYSYFHLHSLLNQLPSIFKQFNLFDQATLTLEIDEDVPSLFECDPFRLEQSFTELIKNTTTHSPGSSMHVNVSIVNLPDTENTLQMIFTDNGNGIPEASMSQIFKPYQVLENSNQARLSGLSLGLPLIYQIFERMNGSIHIENLAEGGLSVCLQLPIKILDAPQHALHDNNMISQNSDRIHPTKLDNNKNNNTLQIDFQNWTESEKIEIFDKLSLLKDYLDLKKPMLCFNFLDDLRKIYEMNLSLMQFIAVIEPFIRHYQFNEASTVIDDYLSQFGGETAYESHR